MKKTYRFATILMLVTLGIVLGSRGQTVTDYDGNVYKVVKIGEQLWIKENLKSLHYSDGSSIPDVKAYNNSASNADVYGRLYTWDAAMRGSTKEGAQGACPNGWHMPSDADWTKLVQHLGGTHLAGGKMKETGTEHWKSPNTGATNASGFTALPSGEHDTEKFQLLGEYGVYWSSTGGTGMWSKYFYLSYDDANLRSNFYDKTFYYSVRCVREEPIGTEERPFRGMLIYPNPFDHLINISSHQGKGERKNDVQIFNQSGQLVLSFTLSDATHQENLQFLPAGIYYLKIKSENKQVIYKKVVKK